MSLGRLLILHDNSVRNAVALIGMAVVWMAKAPLIKINESNWTVLAPATVLFVSGCGYAVRARLLRYRARRVNPGELDRYDIWPLMGAVDRGGNTGHIAAGALCELLPRQMAIGIEWIPNRELSWMHRQLRKAIQDAFPNLRLLRIVIEVQRLVGNAESVTIVTSLADGAVHPDVRCIANSCLQAVIVCAEQSRHHDRLLRAANANDSGSDRLLRIPSCTDSENHGLLLQPGEPPDM